MAADLGSTGAEVSIRELVERATAHRLAGVAPVADDLLARGLVPVNEWLAARPGLDAVVDALARAGHHPQLGAHPVLVVAPGALVGASGDPASSSHSSSSHSSSSGTVVERCRSLAATLTSAVDRLGRAGAPLPSLTIGELGDVAAHAALLARRPAASQLLRPGDPSLHALAADIDRHRAAVEEVSARAGVADRWHAPLSPADARTALQVARDREGAFLSFLNGRWREVRRSVEAGYRFDLHQIRPSVAEVLTELVAHHDAADQLAAVEQACQQRWGSADPAEVSAELAIIGAGPLAAAAAAGHLDAGAAASAANELAAPTRWLLLDPSTTLDAVGRWGAAIATVAPSYEPALLRWRDLGSVPGPVLAAARVGPADLPAIERTLIEADLDRRRRAGPLAVLSSVELDQILDRLRVDGQTLLDLNARVAVQRARTRFEGHLADDGGQLAAGRRILERELDKKRRHRAIRELASGETGPLVADLAPIWLMSPLSVSETLPLDADLFDIVVFDEASQIPVEDAVPTVFRAPQVIVVGDRMQLPPTRFFTTADDDDDDGVLVDADGHNLLVSLDADSFLTQSDLALDSHLLNWHYRSRSESLIAYSNAAFYGGELATVPDRDLPPEPRPAIEVADPAEGASRAPDVLARPISFHRMVDGVYESRRNGPEADYVAELVRSLLAVPERDGGGGTIGVVAFSEAQQSRIEASLAELAVVDPEFGAQLEAEQERIDGDEHVGLFVKNLENVQGDERDIIIMSVCYGPDRNGRMRMNFGPINQDGGERRLNVIFSRARRHMVVVSSIDGAAITNTHNPGAAHLARFLTYAASESIGDTRSADLLLSSLQPVTGDTAVGRAVETARWGPPPPSAVAQGLAVALRQRGLDVDTGVGRSDFRLDLAIRGDGDYLLGVLIDPDTSPDATAAGRFVAEAGVLTAFGWPVHRVVATDWWDDPASVVDRLWGELQQREAASRR